MVDNGRKRELGLLFLAFVPGVIWLCILAFVPTPLGIAEVNRAAVTFYRMLLLACVAAAVVSLVLAGRYSWVRAVRLAVALVAGAAAIAFLVWAIPLAVSAIA